MRKIHLTFVNPKYVEIIKYMGNKPPKSLEELFATCAIGNMFFPYYKNTKGEVQLNWRTCKNNDRILNIKLRR